MKEKKQQPGTVAHCSPAEAQYIRDQLIAYNAKHIPSALQNNYEPIRLTIRDEEGHQIAGLVGEWCWNWVEIDLLWVDEQHRGSGYGSQLLNEAERIAVEKGCTFLKLNTFSFQAPQFYEKHGYAPFGCIADAPLGYEHTYLIKRLVQMDEGGTA